MKNQEKEACPTCEHVGGYCGGSRHPSCGCFDAKGRPAPLKK